MSQAESLCNLLKDGKPHRTDEILEVVYGGSHLGLARCGARIYDIKKRGFDVIGWRDPVTPSLFWYQLRGISATPAKNPVNKPPRVPAVSHPAGTQGVLIDVKPKQDYWL